MVRLETGDTGVAVTADSDGALYSGIFGVDNYVVATGNEFNVEIQSNNKIKVSDGSAIMNGRHIRIPAGDSEIVTINNGSQGMNRIDLVVLRYKKESTGVESVSLVIIQGVEVAGVPKRPDNVKGNILTGAVQADFPLYEVKLEGINITSITPLFQTIGNITELEKKITEINKYLSDIYIVESGEGYVKYSDGRLEMWGRETFSGVNINNRGSTSTYGYNSMQYKIYFPAKSTIPCEVSLLDLSNTGAWISGSTGGSIGVEDIAFWFYCNNAITNTRHIVSWRATGRWK